MFNNNGFVCGMEASKSHLLKKDTLEYRGPPLKRGYRLSWHTPEWKTMLNDILAEISKYDDISQKYQDETNRLISIFRDETKINEWKEYCGQCESKCTFYRSNVRYTSKNESDLFSVIHHTYTSNLYSRNKLLSLEKIYLQ